MRIWPGKPYPLGANWDGSGVNFAIFSENAEKIELCLFDSGESVVESQRVILPEYTDHVWHAYLPDARPGTVYGYRVYGPYDPKSGQRFNPSKVLLDPYAKAIARVSQGHDSVFAYRRGAQDADLLLDSRDNAAFAPLAGVIDPSFDWGEDSRPNTPWHKTVIYETHVRGMTIGHPKIEEGIRGTYAGLASETIIGHLKQLGVTAIELMPIHHKLDEWHVLQRGLTNYWGYNTLAYFAPDVRYSSVSGFNEQVREFKRMVKTFHAHGIEVILDVVYNHTAEGDHLGPTLSLRGIDNEVYYRLDSYDPRYYLDFTGCGNTLNMQNPRVLQLIMDSLRYWVLEMHVDGFRFDLASALARELYEVNKLSAFFDVIHQDPVLSQVKLIAEPWDVGAGGYQVGNFPVLWTEWNGKYRDYMRSFWIGSTTSVAELGTRITGSSDLYGGDRKPYASINFITCHDGFTLQDLVSYNTKHNEQNGEANRDGADDNRSWNCGVEGPTEDLEINALRFQQKRNLMATLLLSAGVPMLMGGDELSRTQRGNNNAYCQDDDISWFSWELDPERELFEKFVKQLIAFRSKQPVLQRRKFFTGRVSPEAGHSDITWYCQDGREMCEADWQNGETRWLAACLSGRALDEMDEHGRHVHGDTLLIMFNAHWEEREYILPHHPGGNAWQLLLETVEPLMKESPLELRSSSKYRLSARSLSLFLFVPER